MENSPQERICPVRTGTAETWIFDLDNTLYPANCNLFAQVDLRITEFIAGRLNLGLGEARRLQKVYFREHGTTLRGLMTLHRISPGEFLEYVHEIDVTPVEPSPALAAALQRLPGRKLIFTNGSTAHAERVMARLGVEAHFDGIFDIAAADYVPKPEPVTYSRLVDRHGVDPRSAVMMDDLPRNLVPAAILGMTTVLVETELEWPDDAAGSAHIHYTAPDLVGWLQSVAGAGAGGTGGVDRSAPLADVRAPTASCFDFAQHEGETLGQFHGA